MRPARSLTAAAFTLAEMLIVLIILGMMVGIAAAVAPRAFERAAMQQAREQVELDLTLAAARARREGDFARLVAADGGRGYVIQIGPRLVRTQAMPLRARLQLPQGEVVFDPTGRASSSEIIIHVGEQRDVLTTNPLTGMPQAARAGDGAGRSPRRRRDPGGRVGAVHRRARRRRRRRQSGAAAVTPADAGRKGAAADTRPLAGRPARGDSRRSALAACLPSARLPREPAGAGRVRGLRRPAPGRAAIAAPGPADGFRRHIHIPRTLPALTLFEVLVALAILSLTLSLLTSSLGPWIRQSRGLEHEARFLREAGSAQLALSELATGAIGAPDAVHRSVGEVRFSTMVPRLSDRPLTASVRLQRLGGAARPSLVVQLDGERPLSATLIDGDEPLRFAAEENAVVVEARLGRTWTPIVVAPFVTSGPETCTFDLISQTCT